MSIKARPWEIFLIASPAGTSARIHSGSMDICHIPKDWYGDGSLARLIRATPQLYALLSNAVHGGCTWHQGADYNEALALLEEIEARP